MPKPSTRRRHHLDGSCDAPGNAPRCSHGGMSDRVDDSKTSLLARLVGAAGSGPRRDEGEGMGHRSRPRQNDAEDTVELGTPDGGLRMPAERRERERPSKSGD